MSERDSLKLTGKDKREFKKEHLSALKKLNDDQKSLSFKEKFSAFRNGQQEELNKFYLPILGDDGKNGTDLQKQEFENDKKELNAQLDQFEKELKDEIGIVQTDLSVLGYDVLKTQFTETAQLLGNFDLKDGVELAPELQNFSRKNKIWSHLFGKTKERKYEKAVKNADVYVNTEDGKKLLSVFGSQVSMTYNEISKIVSEESIKDNLKNFYKTTKNEEFGDFAVTNPNLSKLHALFQQFPGDIAEIMTTGSVVLDTGTDTVSNKLNTSSTDLTDPAKLEAALKNGGYPDDLIKDAKLKLGSLFVDGSMGKASISALAQYDITSIGKNGHLSVYPGIINGVPGLAIAITGPLKNGNRFDVTGTVGVVLPSMQYFGGIDTNLDVSSNVRIDGNARKKIGNVVTVSAGKIGFAVADTFYLSKDKAEGIESDYQLIKKEATAQYLFEGLQSIPAGSDNKKAKEVLTKYLLDKQEKESNVSTSTSTSTEGDKNKDKKNADKSVKFSKNVAEQTAGYLADVYTASGGKFDQNVDKGIITGITDNYADLWKNDQNARASRFGVTGLGVGLICWNGMMLPTVSARLTTRRLRYSDNDSANSRNINSAQKGGNSIDAGRDFASSIDKYNKLLQVQGSNAVHLEVTGDGMIAIDNIVDKNTKTVVAISPSVEGVVETGQLKISKYTKTALVATNEQFGAKYMLIIGSSTRPASFDGYWTNQGKSDLNDLKLKAVSGESNTIKLPDWLRDGKLHKGKDGLTYATKGEKVYKFDSEKKGFVEIVGATTKSEGGITKIELPKSEGTTKENLDISKSVSIQIDNLPSVKTGKSAYEIGLLKVGLRKEYNKFGHALDQSDDATAKLLLKTTLKSLVPAIKDVDKLTHEQLLSIGAELSATKEASSKNYNSKNERFTSYDQFKSQVLQLWGKDVPAKVTDYLDGKTKDPKLTWEKEIFPLLIGKANQVKLTSMLRPFPLIISERNDDLAKRVKDQNVLKQLNTARDEAINSLRKDGSAWYLGARENGQGSISSDNSTKGDIGFTFGYGRVDGKPEVDEKIVTNPYYWGRKDIIPTEHQDLCKYTLEQTFAKTDILSQSIKSSLFASDNSVDIATIESSIMKGMDKIKKGSDYGLTGWLNSNKGVIEFNIGGIEYVLTAAFVFTYYGDCFNETLLIQDVAVAKKTDILVPNAPSSVEINPVEDGKDTNGGIYILNNQTMTQLVEKHAVVGAMGKNVRNVVSTNPCDGGEIAVSTNPRDGGVVNKNPTGNGAGAVLPPGASQNGTPNTPVGTGIELGGSGIDGVQISNNILQDLL